MFQILQIFLKQQLIRYPMRLRVATTRRPPVNLSLHFPLSFYSRSFKELNRERYELGKTHKLSIEKRI